MVISTVFAMQLEAKMEELRAHYFDTEASEVAREMSEDERDTLLEQLMQVFPSHAWLLISTLP